MTRAWLTGWEWSCCGDPFRVGDAVDFGVARRGASHELTQLLGADLAATIDAVESHHEEEFLDRVRGRVTAIAAVQVEQIERHELRRPGFGAPPHAVAPPTGEDWPFVGRELENGMRIGSYPSRYVVVAEPVPESTTTRPVDGIRLTDDSPPPHEQPASPTGPPPDRRVLVGVGWIVSIDED